VAAVLAAYQMSEDPPEEPPLIHCRIGPEEV
jgi:thymidine phosphorylase